MADMGRRPQPEIRERLLDACTSYALECGLPDRMGPLAAAAGTSTRMLVYHFGTRDQLLVALLRHGGRRLHAEVAELSKALADGDCGLDEIVERFSDLYGSGYAELLVGLRQAGWRERGSGLMSDLVAVLHERRPEPRPPIADTQLAIAALNQALLAEALLGPSSRRAAGHTSRAGASEQRTWWVAALTTLLRLDDLAPDRASPRVHATSGARPGRPS